MARNPKLLASALAAGAKTKPAEAPALEDALDAAPSGLQMAAEELLSAIEAKDARGVAEALKSAVEMVRTEEE